MAKNYRAVSKKTGKVVKEFVWFPGMGFTHETVEDYGRRRWPFARIEAIYK